MEYEGWVWKIYSILEKVTHLLYLNLLWIVFTILGLGVFGVFPATAATYTVTRKWLQGKTEIPIFKTFLNAYKKDFLKTNLLGFISIIVGLVLYIDFRFFQTSDHFIFQLLSFLFIFLFFVYFAVVIYLFPVFVTYEFKILEYIKYSFIVAIGFPLRSILLVLATAFILYLLTIIPILSLYFGASIFSIVTMKIAMKAFATETIEQ